MKPDRDHRPLMDALLADAAPIAARTASLAATLGAVRARRHQRRRRQQALAIGALALLLFTANWWLKPRPDASAQPSFPALVRVTGRGEFRCGMHGSDLEDMAPG